MHPVNVTKRRSYPRPVVPSTSAAPCVLVSCPLQVRLESDQAAMKQKEAEAATAAQERDTLRNKLKVLQDQILRGDQATARQAAVQKVRGTGRVGMSALLPA